MITDLLRTRFSARAFQDRPIPAAVLRDILEAGRLSPSGGNEQPWRFGVVTAPALLAQIAEIAYGQSWLARAPLLVVLCVECVEDARGGREIQRQRFPEYAEALSRLDQEFYWALNQEEHQTKIAGAHMALAAWEHGVASCWVSRFDVYRLERLLRLPPALLPAELLAFGYPAQTRPPKPKKALDTLVFMDKLE